MTEEQLAKKIRSIYQRATKETTAKLKDYMSQFERLKEAELAKVKAGTITQAEYEKWLVGKVAMGKRWEAVTNGLAKDMVNADNMARDIINESMLETYADGFNFASYQIAKATDFDPKFNASFTIYDKNVVENLVKNDPDLLPQLNPESKTAQLIREGKIEKWSKQKINSEVTQGILQGESMDKIASRMQNVVGMEANSAMRNARTATNGARNAGKELGFERAEELGIDVEQMWLATLDDRTRIEHRELDGQIRKVGEPFVVDGMKIGYPCDPTADPALVYNCRCTVVPYLPKYGNKITLADRNTSKMTQDYEEWKKGQPVEKTTEKAEPESKQAEKDSRSFAGVVSPERPKRDDFNGDTEAYEKAKEEHKAEKAQYQEQMDKCIEASLERTAFENKEELVDWCKEQGITIDDKVVNDLDIRAFNDIKPALEEMFEKYPQIKGYEFEYHDGSTIKTQFNIGTDRNCLMSANNGLNLNPMYFEDYSNALWSAYDGMARGYFCTGDGTFETLVRHEFGHNMQDYLYSRIADKYHYNPDNWRPYFSTFEEKKQSMDDYHKERDAFDSELRALASLSGASEYSETNEFELFAEGFAEYTSGGDSEFGRAFGEFLERWWEKCT